MTTYVNGFNSGTNGSAVTTSSVASSGYGFHIGGSGGSPVFSASEAIEGALAVSMARSGTSNLNIFTNFALATLDVSFSILFKYKTALPNANDYLFDVRANSASLVRMITNGTTGIPFVQISGANQTGVIATVPLVHDTQYRLDVRIHVSGSTGYVYADFFTPFGSSPIANLGFALTSKNLGTNNIQDINLGPSGANTVTTGTMIIDLCRINDAQSTGYWGPPSGVDAGSATLSSPATMTVNAHATRPGAAVMSNVSTMTVITNSTAVIWDDLRYKWDDPIVQWDGGGIVPNNGVVVMAATSTMTVSATDTPGVYVPPLLGNLVSTIARAATVDSDIEKNGSGKLTIIGGT